MNCLSIQFLKNPKMTGAICPSSKYLARSMVPGNVLDKTKVIVELGPGTGAITGAILAAMPENALFFAVELNGSVISEFRKKYPSVKIYQESAAKLSRLLTLEQQKEVHAVISSLPWASFPTVLQDELLSAIASCMPPGAFFSTYAYISGLLLPAARQFSRKLELYFSKVEKTPVIWRNFPPAFCYYCRK